MASADAIDKNLEFSESARDVSTTGADAPTIIPATMALPNTVSHL